MIVESLTLGAVIGLGVLHVRNAKRIVTILSNQRAMSIRLSEVASGVAAHERAALLNPHRAGVPSLDATAESPIDTKSRDDISEFLLEAKRNGYRLTDADIEALKDEREAGWI